MRDALCAASARITNMLPWYLGHPNAASDDLLQVNALLQQAKNSMTKASLDGDLTPAEVQLITSGLDTAFGYLTTGDLHSAEHQLTSTCSVVN